MTASSEQSWTLDELCAAVAQALEHDYAGSPNGRVRDVPDRRTVRYYTTVGLIDRPAAFRGRTALYGRRHLLQLVAIKQAQAAGHSLGQIQRGLIGRSDVELAELARISETVSLLGGTTAVNPPARSAPFWKTLPAPVTNPAPAVGLRLQGIPLTEEVTLLLPEHRPVTADDLAACRAAALPLIELLQRRGLSRPPGAERTSHDEPPAAAD
jgi:DNA-binding transcriptional MerR regulator